jgi:hypothetical protein
MALSLCQALTQRTALATRERAYHGLVGLSRSMTVQPQWHGGLAVHAGGSQLPAAMAPVRILPAPDGAIYGAPPNNPSATQYLADAAKHARGYRGNDHRLYARRHLLRRRISGPAGAARPRGRIDLDRRRSGDRCGAGGAMVRVSRRESRPDIVTLGKSLDPLTIEVTLPKPDKLALPNLATVYPIIFNSKVAKEHATADDPWALAWLKENTAGSGAYKIETFKPGEQVIMARNEAWNRGTADKSAFFKRVIVQSVPEPATRANLVERGDADLVVDLQASDVQSLEAKGKLKVISTPQYNSVTFVSMNNQIPPFDNVNVRRAIAFALPYDDMFKAALFGRGVAAVRRDMGRWQADERRLSDPAAGEARSREGQGISEGGRHAGRLLDHVQLQCRPGLDRRTDGGPGQGIARQDRHQGRYPEAAGCADVDADQ